MRRASLAALLFAAALVTSCTGEAPPSPSSSPRFAGAGDRAPSFTLPSSDGDTVSLSDYRGRPVLLYFSMGPG